VETIPAKELVVGFPVHATVSAAQRGTIRIETEGRVYGLNLETGEHITPESATVSSAPLALVKTRLVDASGCELGEHYAPNRYYTLWNDRVTTLPDLRLASAIRAGTDDCVVTCTADQIHMLDRRIDERRSLAVPVPLDLEDRVTGGTQGLLKMPPLYIEPGFVVFVRAPALLVVAIEDLKRALVFETAQWSIETILAIRDQARTIPATRGKWLADTVVTATGSLDVRTEAEPVQAVDRMWPPNGWNRVELADHTTVLAFEPPPEHRAFQVPVARYDLYQAAPVTVTWPAFALALELGAAPSAATFEGVVAYAHAVELATRIGIDGKPLDNAYTLLAQARSAKFDERRAAVEAWRGHLIKRKRLAEDAAYVLPALIALAADPSTSDRTTIAKLVANIVRLAAPPTLHALRRCLPLLLDLRGATKRHAKLWAKLIGSIAHHENEPQWFQLVRGTIPELRETSEPIDDHDDHDQDDQDDQDDEDDEDDEDD